MGNICGKTQSDNFSSPGRTVGASSSSSTTPRTAPVPKNVGGPPRTLGNSTRDAQTNQQHDTPSSSSQDDAKKRAAEAAKARAKAATNKPGGKLQSQLATQKKQTRSDTLKEASHQELRTRDADAAAKARNWE